MHLTCSAMLTILQATSTRYETDKSASSVPVRGKYVEIDPTTLCLLVKCTLNSGNKHRHYLTKDAFEKQQLDIRMRTI